MIFVGVEFNGDGFLEMMGVSDRTSFTVSSSNGNAGGGEASRRFDLAWESSAAAEAAAAVVKQQPIFCDVDFTWKLEDKVNP